MYKCFRINIKVHLVTLYPIDLLSWAFISIFNGKDKHLN